MARFSRFPIGRRLAAGSPVEPASNSGFNAVPRLAPRTRAKAACGGTTPCAANDIVSNTTATLECAAQVMAARDDHVDHRHRCDHAEQQPQARDILVRREDRQKLCERDQDQPEADPDPPEIPGAGDAAAAEHDHPDQDEERRHPRDVERQNLHDQGRADIGAEHRGQPRAPDRPARRRQIRSPLDRWPCCSAAPR